MNAMHYVATIVLGFIAGLVLVCGAIPLILICMLLSAVRGLLIACSIWLVDFSLWLRVVERPAWLNDVTSNLQSPARRDADQLAFHLRVAAIYLDQLARDDDMPNRDEIKIVRDDLESALMKCGYQRRER